MQYQTPVAVQASGVLSFGPPDEQNTGSDLHRKGRVQMGSRDPEVRERLVRALSDHREQGCRPSPAGAIEARQDPLKIQARQKPRSEKGGKQGCHLTRMCWLSVRSRPRTMARNSEYQRDGTGQARG